MFKIETNSLKFLNGKRIWKVSVGPEVKLLSRVWLFATPWTVAYQAPTSMWFSRQEYWSRLPFPPPGDLPNPGIKPKSPVSRTLQAYILYHLSHPESPLKENIKEEKSEYIKRHKACKILNLLPYAEWRKKRLLAWEESFKDQGSFCLEVSPRNELILET